LKGSKNKARAVGEADIAESKTVLRPPTSVSLALSARHDPDAYYHTRSGPYVWGDFRRRVVSKAKPVPAGHFWTSLR
jgi:hypothetical protein